jgi:hypothetical protein
VKPEYQERARKNEKTVLNTVQKLTGRTVAERMESSESTVSRFKNGELAEWSAFLACAGLKIVPTEARCYPPHIAEAMLAFTKHNVSRIKTVEELAEDDPE